MQDFLNFFIILSCLWSRCLTYILSKTMIYLRLSYYTLVISSLILVVENREDTTCVRFSPSLPFFGCWQAEKLNECVKTASTVFSTSYFLEVSTAFIFFLNL